jgi:hypothetical protein
MINFFKKFLDWKSDDDGPGVITLNEVLTTTREFFNDLDHDILFGYFKEEICAVNFEDLEINQVFLSEIEKETVTGFGESWNSLETIKDQRHYLRFTVVQCVEKIAWNQGYFSVGNKRVRAMVFREIQNCNEKPESVGQDEYEKNLYLELIGFWFNYWIALYLLREYLDDGREEDYPARFSYEYNGYVDTEFKRLLALAEKENDMVSLYEDELEGWSQQVKVQRGLLLFFWDVTMEGMFLKGYDTSMVCDN